MRWRQRLPSCLALAAVISVGCVTVPPGPSGDEAGESSGEESGGPTVDLGVEPLMDVNASSASFNQAVHPNDYQGGVSAWYFGHAT